MKTCRSVQMLTVSASMVASLAGHLEGFNQPASDRVRTDTPAAQPGDRAPGSALNPQIDSHRQILAPLEGRWTATVEHGPAWKSMPGAPESAGDTATIRAERTWVLDGSFLQESLEQTDPAGAARQPGLVFWGYDEAMHRYSLTTLDAAKGTSCLLCGEWNPDTQAIVFRGLMPDKSGSGSPRSGAAVLRLVSDTQQVMEVFALDEPAPRPAEPSGKAPPIPADENKSRGNGTEVDSAPPGTAKLPSMNPPDRPPGPADATPDVPLDEAHLVMRINYIRTDGSHASAGSKGQPGPQTSANPR